MTIEDRVREALQREADRVVVSPDAWDRIEERAGRRTVTRWQAMTLGAVAAAVVVVAAVVGVRSLGGDDRQQVAVGGPVTTAADDPAATVTTPPPRPSTTGTAPPTTVGAPPSSSTSAPTTSAPPSTDTTAPPTTEPPTTTTAPTPGPLLDESDVLYWGSLGPISTGDTIDELEAATDREWFETYPNEGSSCGFVSADGLPAGVSVMVDGQTVVRIDVEALPTDAGDVSPGIETEAGVGVGSTEQQVRDAYGEDVTVEPHPYRAGGHYLVVFPPGGELPALLMIMETDGEVVTSFRTGFEPAVRQPEGCS